MIGAALLVDRLHYVFEFSSVHSTKMFSTVPAGSAAPLKLRYSPSLALRKYTGLSARLPKSNSTGVAAPPDPAADTLLCCARMEPTAVPRFGLTLEPV